MNTFTIKAIILSAIVAFYGECEGQTHYVAAGNGGSRGWGSIPTTQCVEDGSNQAPLSAPHWKFGKSIVVSCCQIGAQSPADSPRRICKAFAKTYDEAKAICEGTGKRLCSKDEMLGGWTKGKGCSFDWAYNWVSDECSVPGTGNGIEGGDAPAEGLRSEHRAETNSRDSVTSAMEIETSNGAEGWSFDIESASIGFALGLLLVSLAVFAVNKVQRKKREKSDEIAMVSQQTEDKAQETPANVVTVVESVVETEME